MEISIDKIYNCIDVIRGKEIDIGGQLYRFSPHSGVYWGSVGEIVLVTVYSGNTRFELYLYPENYDTIKVSLPRAEIRRIQIGNGLGDLSENVSGTIEMKVITKLLDPYKILRCIINEVNLFCRNLTKVIDNSRKSSVSLQRLSYTSKVNSNGDILGRDLTLESFTFTTKISTNNIDKVTDMSTDIRYSELSNELLDKLYSSDYNFSLSYNKDIILSPLIIHIPKEAFMENIIHKEGFNKYLKLLREFIG